MPDMSKIWDEIGKRFAHGLSDRMRKQIGINGVKYRPPKQSTLDSRRKYKSGAKSPYRLYVTHDTANRAFNYSPGPKSVTIFVNESLHKDGGATYDDIIRYNSNNMPECTNTDSPLVFPQKPEEIAMMRKELSEGFTKFANEYMKQVGEDLKRKGLTGNEVFRLG